MTDMSVSAASTAQAAAAYAAGQVANAATDPAEAPASSNSDNQIVAGQNSMPEDIVELSDEALAAAFDLAYTQWVMGWLYTDDTVAGTGTPLTKIETEKVEGDPVPGDIKVGDDYFRIIDRNPGNPGDATAYQTLQKQIWGGDSFRPIFLELEAFDKHKQWEREAFRHDKALVDALYFGQSDSDAYKEALQAVYKKYGRDEDGNQIVDPVRQAIIGLYGGSDDKAALNGAIDIALGQRGIKRNEIANIDIGHVALNGKVQLTFKDGRDPLDLDEDYVTLFAINVLQDERAERKKTVETELNAHYGQLIKDLGVNWIDIEGWSVTKDGKFHLFTSRRDDGGEQLIDHVIDDPALAAVATDYNQMSLEDMRISHESFNARQMMWARISGYEPPPDGPPTYDDPPIDWSDVQALQKANFEKQMAAAPAQPADNANGSEASATNSDEPEETEAEKEAARARRKLLLSMGIRAESNPDDNKPGWMSSGEIARLNARYADAMSARDRMLQRFTRKGELEGITDGITKEAPKEIADRASPLSQES
ncbi:hypothetical protein [Radicibacter daui]|uniref:hypothetical protein n=1 Tax=Radicibacter daui TaxID=3064829 RepID=UPI004046BA01